ncbi:DNA ligase 1 [Ricinus communis]|uniref:DNA ligase 1 n=1 Tax=Ricinus communis TaxID=3988 RepID=UPI00201AB173|nr:DNA ligase 1 [Ricinus communis]
MENGIVDIYSRNLERSTKKYPDIVRTILRYHSFADKKPSTKSFVLDCEIVAYDRVKDKILPFQVLLTRSRKNVDVDDIKVKACIFAFDILYLNGQPLLHQQLKVRQEYLHGSLNEESGFLQFPTALISSDPEEIQQFLLSAERRLDNNGRRREKMGSDSYEGLVIKKLSTDAAYVPNKRDWLKLKKDYMASLWDSLDLVPIAAFYGCGKRTGLYGSFLLACYDYNKDEFQSICKTGWKNYLKV